MQCQSDSNSGRSRNSTVSLCLCPKIVTSPGYLPILRLLASPVAIDPVLHTRRYFFDVRSFRAFGSTSNMSFIRDWLLDRLLTGKERENVDLLPAVDEDEGG